jgi:peptidoglycan/xylan/chitin deacetylase (PgdA/CDA1 family)
VRWPIREVLAIPAVEPAPGSSGEPRLPAVLGFLLEQLAAHACQATIAFYGQTVREHPELVRQTAGANCEIALAGDEPRDPLTLPPGSLRDELEAATEAVVALGLPKPTRFAPPGLLGRSLTIPQEAALREAGIREVIGCRTVDLPAVPLATLAGRPLAGALIRLTPVWLLRRALAAQPGAALWLTPADIDPGATAHGFGRAGLLRRLPRLLVGGFTSAAEAARLADR